MWDEKFSEFSAATNRCDAFKFSSDIRVRIIAGLEEKWEDFWERFFFYRNNKQTHKKLEV